MQKQPRKNSNRYFGWCLIINIQIVMIIKPINARSGIVIKPSQLIYWPEQGTPEEHVSKAFSAGIFCSA
jgi:hypothetical protein